LEDLIKGLKKKLKSRSLNQAKWMKIQREVESHHALKKLMINKKYAITEVQ